MKEEIKKYLKISYDLQEVIKEINKGEEELHKKQYEVHEYLSNHTMEETKQHFKNYYKEETEEEKQKTIDLYNKRKMLSLKLNLQFNNTSYIFLKLYENEFRKVMEKYENKNIGEKTKEKIQEEIKTLLYQNKDFSNCEIYPYFNGDFQNYNISIEIRKKQGEKYIYDFKYKFEKKTSYNCYEDATKVFYYTYSTSDFSYCYNSINDLFYIGDTTKEAKRIIKEEERNKKKIEEKKEELKKLVKNYNNFITSYNLNEEKNKSYKIDYTLYLY